MLSIKKNRIQIIAIVILLFLTACKADNNMYSFKTEITNYEAVEKILTTLDWKDYKFNSFKVEDKDIFIKFEGLEKDFSSEDQKTMVINAIEVLLLVEGGERVVYKYSETPFFEIGLDEVDLILKSQFGKSSKYYIEDAEKFKELKSKLLKLDFKKAL